MVAACWLCCASKQCAPPLPDGVAASTTDACSDGKARALICWWRASYRRLMILNTIREAAPAPGVKVACAAACSALMRLLLCAMR